MTMGTTRQLRIEDEPLLRGKGRYTADVREPRQAVAAFLRAPMASATVRRLDTAAAQRASGVLAVLTAADMAGTGSLAHPLPVPGRGGSKLAAPRWPALAEGRVLHAGQPVAMVVAETPAQAQDAVELIDIDYDERAAVVDARRAIESGASQIWPEAPGNVALDFTWPLDKDGSNAAEVAKIIAGAPLVARLSVSNQRLAVASMEPRTATGWYDAKTGEYTLRTGTQSVWLMANQMAELLGVKPGQMRVVTEDVGGAFGMKTGAYPEYVAVLVAAKRIGRPVGWASTRAEAFLSDSQARDQVMDGELALDKDGKFLALRVKSVADMGAFANGAGPLTATINMVRCFPSVYRIPRIVCDVLCVLTNTVQLGPYRGAGRPEANYLLERLVDEAARVSGIDRVSLRRRNLIPKSAVPYRTPVGTTYDSGDFPAVFEKALAASGYKDFPKRRRESRKQKKYRGIGICCFVEHSGGVPTEGASMMFPGKERLEVGIGVQATGQAHASVFSRLAAAQLGIPARQVQVRLGDTHLNVTSSASVASRSTQTVGTAIVRAAEAVVEKGRKVAAHLLEAADADVVYRDGSFEVAGTDRRLSLFEVADRAHELATR